MKSFKITLLFLLITGLYSCQTKVESNYRWHAIQARSSDLLYRAQVPHHWICQPLDPLTSLQDTTQPVCVFLIGNAEKCIRLSIHPFPYTEKSERISPEAQIFRWKQQFEKIHPQNFVRTPCSFGGFHGLRFEANGYQQNKPLATLAWSMQLAQFFDQQLDSQVDMIKRADYTIKAVGPPELMQQHRHEIIAFAESFELINELPSPL